MPKIGKSMKRSAVYVNSAWYEHIHRYLNYDSPHKTYRTYLVNPKWALGSSKNRLFLEK